MKKTTIVIMLFFAAITFYQCSTPTKVVQTPPTNQASKADKELATAQKRWPDATKESLLQGYNIYNNQCMKCHGDKGITNRSEAEWGIAIAAMAPKARLTDAEKETLTRYVYSAREAATAK